MTLKHPKAPQSSAATLSMPPLFTLEGAEVPRHRLPDGELPPDVAYQVIHDELMLDGNARLNVAGRTWPHFASSFGAVSPTISPICS